ncbi:nitrous oxide reductase family maturation protein NosD [Halobacteriaceae archaeon GCM10025711]
MFSDWSRSLGVASVVLLAVLAGTTIAAVHPVAAQAIDVDSCTTIDESGRYVLTADLEPANATECIVVAASDVTLDGDDHAITGTGNGTGVSVVDATNETVDVEINDLTVQNWTTSVRFESASGTVDDVTATDNRFGVRLVDAGAVGVQDSEFTANTVGVNVVSSTAELVRNDLAGNEYGLIVQFVDAADGDSVLAERNVFEANAEVGVLVEGSTATDLVDNEMTGNGDDGVLVENSSNVVVLRNAVEDNGDDGVTLVRSDRNLVERNVVVGNVDDGLVLADADRNTLLRNVVSVNGGDGILLRDADGNRVERNVITQNDGRQIRLGRGSSGNRFVQNDAD